MVSWRRLRLRPPSFLLYALLFASTSKADDGAISETAPALYSGKYGDCMDGQSLFTPTRFDVAYDNATVIVQVDGSTNISDQDLQRKP